ncbi:MAG: OmpA family protein [Akkermansiaceae bacterium]
MDDDYSWNGGLRGTSSFRLPENEGLGKWVTVALLMAVILHAVVLVGLSRIDVILPELVEQTGLQTQTVRVNRVDLADARPEVAPPEPTDPPEPVPIVPPADELDVLENLPEMDIDISPNIETLEVPMAKAAAKGDLDGESLEPMKAPVFEPDLPDMGKTEDFFPRSRDSQVTVDPGARMAEKHDPDAYADTLRKGADGNADDGLLKDFTSLDAMARMDGNSLLTTKALIGSDLLFDFNSATLRQSARVSLMKVALLIDKHPDLICWVDGHTDLIGGVEGNMVLSQRRAMAVKDWLVETLDLDKKRVAVRGFGKSMPLVQEGTQQQQAPNRRVEIKMRKNRPESEVGKIASSDTAPAPAPEKKPAKAIPVDEELPAPTPKPPKAIVEPEPAPAPPRAVPVE